MNLTEILDALRQWLAGLDVPARVLTDRADALRVIFETENGLAELLAGGGACAPYRFVSFTGLDLRQDPYAEPVFSFCDDASHTAAEILRELDRGMAVMGMLTGSQ